MGLPAALFAACAFSSFPAYDILSTNVTRPHSSLERVEYRVEVDGQPLNRFSISHVSKRHGGSKGEVLLLSPFSLPGAFYEISETGDYQKSAAGELAKSGYDVWLVDQRRTRLPVGACESGTDCSAVRIRGPHCDSSAIESDCSVYW